MADSKKAELAPKPRPTPTAEQLHEKFARILASFCLRPLPPFSIVVEGTTDRDYLTHAAQLVLYENGKDLLAVPESLSPKKMRVLTPCKPGTAHRGGIPQVVRLANEIHPYVFTLEMVRGIVFVFDHDDEGIRARDKLAGSGYTPGTHLITIDPKEHPNACAAKQVVIEDLLSLRIQHDFFQQGSADCDACYEGGKLKRYRWKHDSKRALCDYARKEGTLEDFGEIIALIRRARHVFGLPTEGLNAR